MNIMPYQDDYLPETLKVAYGKYVDHIMRGCTQYEAAQRCRILPEQIGQWIRDAESSSFVQNLRAEKLKAFDAATAWTPQSAVVKLLEIIHDNFEKGSTKLAAVKELNMLMGITIVDEKGNTRVGKSLADFYRDLKKPLTAEVGELHPEPGSAGEAAFLSTQGGVGSVAGDAGPTS